MTWTWRLFTVRGIEVRVHPTMLLVVCWAAWHWGTHAFDPLLGVLFSLFLIIAIFVSVAGHELAHAIFAHRSGLAVNGITLLPIGGVAQIEPAPLLPTQEARIAWAGPALNLCVTLLLTPVVVVSCLSRGINSIVQLAMVMREVSVTNFVLVVWGANLCLALFNLVPAFPLDGGRVLRAWLTVIFGRRIAGQVAVLFGYAAGVALLLAGLYFRDPLIGIIAVFMLAATLIEQRLLRLELAMRRLPVGQFAVWDMGGIAPDASLVHALHGGPRDLAVVDAEGQVVGMLWREDVLRYAALAYELTVRDVMDPHPVTVDLSLPVYDAYLRMLETGHPAVPVTERGRYRGIFTADRLLHVYRFLGSQQRKRDYSLVLAELLGLVAR